MINFFNHHNEFILPLAADRKPCGESYTYYMKKWGCNFSIPFSAFHRYYREDSKNMNKFCTPIKEHYKEFNNKVGELLPAFISWDSTSGTFEKINPKKNDEKYESPEFFGDNWDDDMENIDKDVIEEYFTKFHQIKKKFGFLSFKIGKSEFNIKFSNKKEGIQFHTPRNSLIYSIKNNIFDDLLIGNYMKVKLINVPSLYPNFTPYVTKYGDNGLASTKSELEKYFEYYRFNSSNFWIDFLKIKTEQVIRDKIQNYKSIYYFARKVKRNLN